MKFAIIALLALVKADEEVMGEAAEESTAEVVALPGPLPTYVGGPTVDFAMVGETATREWMFTVKGVPNDNWLGLSWGGSDMVNMDMLWLSGNGETLDMYATGAGAFPPTDSKQSWTFVKTDGDNVKDFTATSITADMLEAEDIAFTCGTAEANMVMEVEWVARTTGNANDAQHDKDGDMFFELDETCAVVWWNPMRRPVVVAGAQALAGAVIAASAVAALF